MKNKTLVKGLRTKSNLGQGGRRSSNTKGLQSKIVKGSKGQKGRRIPFRLFNTFGTEAGRQVRERFGRYVLYAQGWARLSARQLEAGRRAIKRVIRRHYELSLRVYPFSPCTKRPSDVRMGKGKGTKICDWIYPIRPGKVIFELRPHRRRRLFRRQAIYRRVLSRALSLAQTKFPMATAVRQLRD
jgi:large subunit ribosomal protein L16